MTQFNPQAKLLAHGERVQEWLDIRRTSPILAEISPTGYCNAHCDFCSFGDKHEKTRIDPKVLCEAICAMKRMGLKAINWSGGGEPTLHPQFDYFVQLAHDLGLEQGLFSNAYRELPHQHYFSWIRITYTDKGISNAKMPRVPFGIVFNQTVDDELEHIQAACLEARDFGASYFQVRPALTGDYRTQPPLVEPTFLQGFSTPSFQVHVTHYKYLDAARPHGYPECYGYHFVPSIDWNGKVSVCLYRTLESDYQLGDLNVETFPEIWLKLPDSARVTPECWNCCKNHEINKSLYAAKTVEQPNFI